MQAVFAGHIPTNQEAAEFPEFYFYGRTLAEKGWPLAASLLPSEWLSDNVRFSLSPPPPLSIPRRSILSFYGFLLYVNHEQTGVFRYLVLAFGPNQAIDAFLSRLSEAFCEGLLCDGQRMVLLSSQYYATVSDHCHDVFICLSYKHGCKSSLRLRMLLHMLPGSCTGREVCMTSTELSTGCECSRHSQREGTAAGLASSQTSSSWMSWSCQSTYRM